MHAQQAPPNPLAASYQGRSGFDVSDMHIGAQMSAGCRHGKSALTCQRALLVRKDENQVDHSLDSMQLHVPDALAVLSPGVDWQRHVAWETQLMWHMPEEAPHTCRYAMRTHQ